MTRSTLSFGYSEISSLCFCIERERETRNVILSTGWVRVRKQNERRDSFGSNDGEITQFSIDGCKSWGMGGGCFVIVNGGEV